MPARHAHRYLATVTWTGNTGTGTSGHLAYARAHDIAVAGKPTLAGSSDPGFRGDAGRHNPEDLLVASLSACHMLWFLSTCAEAGVVVTAYEDKAEGTMVTDARQDGQFTEVVLHPAVSFAQPVDPAQVAALHHRAHARCYIARSVNFPVRCVPVA